MSLVDFWRLGRAGYVLAREGAFSLIDAKELSPSARLAIGALRLVERGSVRRTGRVERLTRALNRLGPTYVKFGQTLATRPDIVGAEIAEDLGALQDSMDPFDPKLVPNILSEALGVKAEQIIDLSPPIAAASIAQVHKARFKNRDGVIEDIAVKVLRPGVERRFRNDLKSYYRAAKWMERLVPPMRRLRPVAVVETLERSARLELDLRFEAAAISEMAENAAHDEGFAVPKPHWDLVARNVLTTSWINGVSLRDGAALDAAGIDRATLARHVVQNFLRHAIRDGFFHADMHPGNLFADPKTHGVIAVDFGITGRINAKERQFLADILLGFITRDYRRIAKRHIEIGYVPAHHSVDDFALAIRSIGEPLHGRLSRDMSMAHVLGQLLAITETFDMVARPELILLQKTMVLVEGVARELDPDLNIWTVSEPVVRQWLTEQAGPKGRLKALGEHVDTAVATLGRVPGLMARADAALADYEAQQHSNHSRNLSWLFGIAAVLVSLASIVAIWKLL